MEWSSALVVTTARIRFVELSATLVKLWDFSVLYAILLSEEPAISV